MKDTQQNITEKVNQAKEKVSESKSVFSERFDSAKDKVYKSKDDIVGKANEKLGPSVEDLKVRAQKFKDSSSSQRESIVNRLMNWRIFKATGVVLRKSRIPSVYVKISSKLRSVSFSGTGMKALETFKNEARALFAEEEVNRGKAYSRREAAKHQRVEEEDDPNIEYSKSKDIIATQRKKDSWEKVKEKVAETTAFKKVQEATDVIQKTEGYKTYAKARDRVSDKIEDARDAYETSQNPIVWHLREVGDTLTEESDAGRAFGKIIEIYPEFTIPDFLKEMEYYMIPSVITAYRRGDMSTLSEVCEGSAYKAVLGEFTQRKTLGITYDDKILDIRRVEYTQAQMLNQTDPVIVFTFMCQHICCHKDLIGNIVHGSPHQIENIFYSWAVAPDVVSLDYNWKLVEMMAQDIQYLL